MMTSIYRSAEVYVQNSLAGILKESEEGYSFKYDESYLVDNKGPAISLTMPLTDKEYVSSILFPFFDGLIPEGWLLNVIYDKWENVKNDRFGILLIACRDCIGDVSIRRID